MTVFSKTVTPGHDDLPLLPGPSEPETDSEHPRPCKRHPRSWKRVVALIVAFAAGALGLGALVYAAFFRPEVKPLRKTPAAFSPPNRDVYGGELLNSTGLTDKVYWDSYSYLVKPYRSRPPQRIYVQGGEIHPWRLPVPALWRDVIQKTVASGANTISIYTNWAMTETTPGRLDLEGVNNWEPFIIECKKAGLWVIARPGPYINAETTGGGIPGWVTARPGEIRTNDTGFHETWQLYFKKMNEIVERHQISHGGPVILYQKDNEYEQIGLAPVSARRSVLTAENGCTQDHVDQSPSVQYMQELEDASRSHGIVVPTMFNEPDLKWANPHYNGWGYGDGLGSPDIYGLDLYPIGFNCEQPRKWPQVATTYREYLDYVAPWHPKTSPEFQGGAFDFWGSTSGHNNCLILTGEDYTRVFYLNNIAQGFTAVNFYMMYGGTNWGQLAFPTVYTSYDYAAVIGEGRELVPKYGEFKLQSLFLRSMPDLYKTDLMGEGSGMLTTNRRIYTTALRNPDTGASFYVVRQSNSSSFEIQSFKLDINTYSYGWIRVPELGGQITLNGRDSRILVAEVQISDYNRIFYCMSATIGIVHINQIDDVDIILVEGTPGFTYEMAFDTPRSTKMSQHGPTKADYKKTKNRIIINFVLEKGLTAIRIGRGKGSVLVIVTDYRTATSFWAPAIAQNPKDNYAGYIQFETNQTVLVQGPYLVRNASIDHRDLDLWGDINRTTPVTIVAPSNIRQVTWNGQVIDVKPNVWGAYEATLEFERPNFSFPNFERWKFIDSLPEVKQDFDDSKTNNPYKPFYGDPWILYANDYGYHVGNLIWRGHFSTPNLNHDSTPTAVNLSISGGSSFAASVWLNDVFLGSMEDLARLKTMNETFYFPQQSVKKGENVLTVLQDHMGYNQSSNSLPGGSQDDIKLPRGIQGYYLISGDNSTQFDHWKVAGNYGGQNKFPDRIRTILNEGGLFAERKGYHLPGFDDSSWEERSPQEGIPKVGVGFYRTTFELILPEGYDIPLAFVFDGDEADYRCQLYVNGWQMAKRVANLGPQNSFRVHEGILNYNGTNTLALSHWALQDHKRALRLPALNLVESSVYKGGPGRIKPWGGNYVARPDAV